MEVHIRRRWSEDIKRRAKELRRQGNSFGNITRELQVSKSTLHQWIRGLKRPVNFTKLDRIRWAKEIQPMGAKANSKKREEKIASLKKSIYEEVDKIGISDEIAKALLAILYWAEGSKGRGALAFANTDPRIMLLYATLLRRSYVIDEKRLRVRLHLHWYHKVRQVRRYWSTLLDIPESQFGKIYHKKRSKEKTFRKNFGGICFLRYNNDYLREQVMNYAYALGEKITRRLDVPVA